MTSFIVVSKTKTQRDEYIKTFCIDHAIDAFDMTLLTLESSVKQNTQSIGIEDIKQMQKKLFLKPIKSKTKAVIIEEANLLTHEAQNALLKVLEEPPAHTMIILATDLQDALLPTIISRCQIIQLEEEQVKLSEKKLAEFTEFIDNLPTLTVGERLKKAEALAKDKEKAIIWLSKLIIVLREKLIAPVISTNTERRDLERESLDDKISHSVRNDKYYFQQIRAFQTLHTLLKTTNVNPRFAIEDTLLKLSLT